MSLFLPGKTLLAREDITHRLDQIRCPVLLIHGEDDPVLTIDKAQLIEAAVPECRGSGAGSRRRPCAEHDTPRYCQRRYRRVSQWTVTLARRHEY